MVKIKKYTTAVFIILHLSGMLGGFGNEPEFYELGTDHGLSNSNVLTIHQGSDGFMWIGTYSGLNKYDGYNFTIYRHNIEDSTSISDNFINGILTDSDDNLWIGTNDGLNRYRPRYDDFVRYLPGHYIDRIKVIDKKLYICSRLGLGIYNAQEDSFRVYTHNPHDPASINSSNVLDLITLNDGTILVGTDKPQLQQFNPETGKFTDKYDNPGLPTDAYTKTLCYDSEDRLWIGTTTKIVRYNPDNNTIFDYSGNNLIDCNKIIEMPGKKIYLATLGGGGLQIFDLETDRIEKVLLPDPRKPHSLNSPDIFDVYLNQDILWVGTYGSGINVHDPIKNKFETFRNNPFVNNSLSPRPVTSIFIDSENRLWVGTDHGGLNLYLGPEKGFKHYRQTPGNPRSLNSDAILDIVEHTSGKILLATWGGGINALNPENGQVEHFVHNPDNPHSILSDNVVDIHMDEKGRIWATAWREGIAQFNFEQGTFEPINNYDTLPPYLRAIQSTPDGNIWITGENAGIWIYNPETRVLKPISEYTNDPATLMLRDGWQFYLCSDNFMWVAADEGLFQIDPETKQTVNHYTVKDGLPTNSLFSIIQDNSGELWAGSSKGISNFNPITEEFTNYGLSDGIQGNQFKEGSVAKDTAGNLYFGGNKGFNKFHPQKIPVNKRPPEIVFTDFKIFNTSINPKDENSPLKYHINKTNEIILNYTDKVFSFEFAALNYTNPKENKYAFRLLDFDKEWKQAGHERIATYTNIDPGKYVFQVKGTNNDGVWSDEIRSINIIITPPFWDTTWFRILMIAIIIALVLLFIRYRTEETRKRNRLLKEEQDKLRTIFEAIPDITFLINANGNILETNSTFLARIGLSASEIKEKNIRQIFSHTNQQKLFESLEILKKNHEIRGIEIEIKTVDLGLRDFEINAIPISDYRQNLAFLYVARDITDRKEMELKLQRAGNYIRNIINSMPSLLVGVDVKGNITQWNSMAQKTTGLNVDQVLGKPLEKVIPYLKDEMNSVEEALSTREVQTNLKYTRLVGNEIRYEDVTVYPLVSNGIEGAVIRIDDITERVRLEEMMVQSEKMISVGGLAAGMAHEINNPLGGMMQTASVMYDRLTNLTMPANIRDAQEAGISLEGLKTYMEKRKIIEMLGRIKESGIRAADIVQNMLSFSRKSSDVFSSYSPELIMDKSIELSDMDYDLKKKYDFRQIKIIREYEKNLPPVPCESAKIQQVIINILRNGAEAMHAGASHQAGTEENTMASKQAQFILRLKREKNKNSVRFEIEDNGPGMDEAVRKRVFEPFFTTKPTGQGTGLGLSVSYFIITENHKGEMWVESKPGVGTKFIFNLPYTR
ncbi:MAG: PAS domain S-box protein [Bacteroidota bacterium]